MKITRVPPTKKGDFFISFVEEGIFDSKYENYAGGRVEIYSPKEQYAIEEVRFFTIRDDKWIKYRDKWDFKDLTERQLKQLKKTIKKKFYVRTS